MTRKKKPIHPIDFAILRSMKGLKLRVTPTKIARNIGVHPMTVKNRLIQLRKKHLVDSIQRGNRLYVKIKLLELKKMLKKRN